MKVKSFRCEGKIKKSQTSTNWTNHQQTCTKQIKTNPTQQNQKLDAEENYFLQEWEYLKEGRLAVKRIRLVKKNMLTEEKLK